MTEVGVQLVRAPTLAELYALLDLVMHSGGQLINEREHVPQYVQELQTHIQLFHVLVQNGRNLFPGFDSLDVRDIGRAGPIIETAYTTITGVKAGLNALRNDPRGIGSISDVDELNCRHFCNVLKQCTSELAEAFNFLQMCV